MSEEKIAPNVLVRFHYYPIDDKKRRFYGSQDTLGGNCLNYIDTGVRVGKYSDYLDYASNREKTIGTFGPNGLPTKENKQTIRRELSKTTSNIWDMLISFEENFGKEKIKNWHNAMDLINSEFPKLLKDNNMLIDNVV